jgi:hypothetical protein
MPGSLAGGAAARAYARGGDGRGSGVGGRLQARALPGIAAYSSRTPSSAAIAAKRIARPVDSLLVIGRHPRDVEH